MIDPATGWFEIAHLEENNSYSTQKAFDSCWLAWYPRPKYIGCDNRFTKKNVSKLIDNCGWIRKSLTKYNPQSNVQQVLENALQNFEIEYRNLDDQKVWDEFLILAALKIRSTNHITLGALLAQLLFLNGICSYQ